MIRSITLKISLAQLSIIIFMILLAGYGIINFLIHFMQTSIDVVKILVLGYLYVPIDRDRDKGLQGESKI